MTGSNPPQGPTDDDMQWWSTPANTSSVTGTDPTILGAGNQFGAPGYAQQPNSQQQFSQQSYPQQPYAQPSYVQPTPGPQPIAGYTGQQYTGDYGQQPRRNNTLWIVGGVIGVAVVIAIALTIVAAYAGHSTTSSSLLDKKKVDGNYALTNVTNACSLVDPTVLGKWAPTPKPNPEHTERAPDGTIGGGSLECDASYEGVGEYSTNGSELSLDAEFQTAFGPPDYDMWKSEDTGTTGSGRDSGALAGIGTQAYYASEEQDYSSFKVLEYTCATQDSNVSVKIKFRIESDTAADKGDVSTTCQSQLKKVLTELHK